MNIISVKESGCNYTLLWALQRGADVFNDLELQSIVNDELFYLVTLDDVNFFQLFRLTQMYREKLRIVASSKADVPTRKVLSELFPGKFNPDNKPESEPMELSLAAEHALQNFMNIVQQMTADDDIIKTNAVRMFIPMLNVKYQVQIPVGFYDFVSSMKDDDEAKEIFNEYYPSSLQTIIENHDHGVNRTIQLGIVKATQIIKYHKRYDQYLKIVKYSPLKSYKGNEIYKFGLIGFHKYDNVGRGEVRCNLFNIEKNSFDVAIRNINRLQTPLNIDFVIELPITYMQLLDNIFSREDLPTIYESSMSDIIDGGIRYDDFITFETPTDAEMSEEEQEEYEKHNNAISAYRTRITEANQILLNSLQLILEASDIDVTSAFAMLPPIYMTKAVVTLDLSKTNKYLSVQDDILREMFTAMLDTAKNITEDINKSK